MRKHNRISAAIALAAGASVLAGTGNAVAVDSHIQGHEGKAHTVPDREAGNSGKTDTDPNGNTPGQAPGKDGKSDGKGDDRGGKPGNGGGKTEDDTNGDGKKDKGDKKSPEDPEGLFGFCPPLKDINLGWQGLHLNFPLIGGVQEGVPDLKIDPLCANLDYPSMMHPSDEKPKGPPGNQAPPQTPPNSGAPGQFPGVTDGSENPGIVPVLGNPQQNRTDKLTDIREQHNSKLDPAQSPLSDLFSGATSSGAGTGSGTAESDSGPVGGLL